MHEKLQSDFPCTCCENPDKIQHISVETWRNVVSKLWNTSALSLDGKL